MRDFLNLKNYEKENIKKMYDEFIFIHEQIQQGMSNDPYQYKKEGNQYFFAQKGSNQWKKVTSSEAINAIQSKIFNKSSSQNLPDKEQLNQITQAEVPQVKYQPLKGYSIIYKSNLFGREVNLTSNGYFRIQVLNQDKISTMSPLLGFKTSSFYFKTIKIDNRGIFTLQIVTNSGVQGETNYNLVLDQLLFTKITKFIDNPSLFRTGLFQNLTSIKINNQNYSVDLFSPEMKRI